MNSGGDWIDRHVLDREVFAASAELEPAIGADAKAHVVQPRPGVVVGAEQHGGICRGAVAQAKRPGGRSRHVLLDVLEVNVD
jgi:hypothetical protein